LSLLRRDRRIAIDQSRHYTAQSFDTQGQWGYIQQKNVFHFTTQDATLNRGTDQRWRFCSIESIGDGASEDPTVALL
jgi:hypothetical protein